METAKYINDGKRTPGFRCGKCDRLLAEGGEQNKVEIRCDRCGVLNRLLEKMSDMVVITDRDGIILFVNEELEKVSGYNMSEALGKRPSLWGGQMPKEFYQAMWETLLQKKQGVSVKVTNRHKSGYLYDALLRISPVLGTQGEIEFLVGIETLLAKHPT